MIESFTFNSLNVGKKLLITGAVHGNETCGSIACNNIIDALKKTNDINGELRILIAGSLYFCGDVLSLIENY